MLVSVCFSFTYFYTFLSGQIQVISFLSEFALSVGNIHLPYNLWHKTFTDLLFWQVRMWCLFQMRHAAPPVRPTHRAAMPTVRTACSRSSTRAPRSTSVRPWTVTRPGVLLHQTMMSTGTGATAQVSPFVPNTHVLCTSFFFFRESIRWSCYWWWKFACSLLSYETFSLQVY